MLGIIAGAAIIAFLGVQIYRTQNVYKEELERFYQISKNKVTVIPASNGWVMMHLGLFVVLCGLAVYTAQHPEQAGRAGAAGLIAVCIGLMAVLLLNVTVMRKYQELYVNKDGFNDHGKTVRFTSIKDIHPGLTNYTVETVSGQSVKINAGAGKELMKLMDEKQAK